MRLPHSGSTLSLLLSREQEREAGLTRNDYFSLWQAQGYAKSADEGREKAPPVHPDKQERLADLMVAPPLTLAASFISRPSMDVTRTVGLHHEGADGEWTCERSALFRSTSSVCWAWSFRDASEPERVL